MLEAVELARQGKGRTAPNPCVGALLVRDGQILAQGWHRAYGQAHAEVEAIGDARAKNINPETCSLVVTLEPCNHTGKTPPCTEGILAAGIKHVIVGTRDPNPSVSGGGADYLQSRGVVVDLGVAEQACQDLIADFIVWKTTNRPYVYVKLASTLDGRIACASGHSSWITGPEAREMVHKLRRRVQAVIVGGNTFRKDNPQLTSRLDQSSLKPEKQPVAVIVSSQLPKSTDSFRLLAERPEQTIFWTDGERTDRTRLTELEALGCRIWPLPRTASGGFDLSVGMTRLRQELGCHDVLCEGGGLLALSLAEQAFMDELWLFQAPKILGDERAVPLFSGRHIECMDQALVLRRTNIKSVGQDVLQTFRPVRN